MLSSTLTTTLTSLLTLTLTPLTSASSSPQHPSHTPAYLSPNATALRTHALDLMHRYPLLDTHVDLPQILRTMERRPLDGVDSMKGNLPGHVDIPKMKQGRLGGLFMTVYTPCPGMQGQDEGEDFTRPLDTVRDNVEMIDLIQNMVNQNSDTFSWAHTTADIRENHKNGKISAFLGAEGAHILGNSLSTLRIYAQLGVKYLTLTHICHNAFASSAGWGKGFELEPKHKGNGLTDLGRELVREMNRLGMMVDLSHVSWETMQDALDTTRAPLVFTHSGANSVNAHPRNVPDHILDQIGEGTGKRDAVILSVFYPPFVDITNPTVGRVADHIEYIAQRVGKRHVGIASDFDGMYASVEGLEDASKYPHLIMEMLQRGWTDSEIQGLMGENLMRIMDGVQDVARTLAHELPSRMIYDKRTDLPANWGGKDNAYLPTGVREFVRGGRKRDEL